MARTVAVDARPVVPADAVAPPVPTGREEAWRFTPLRRLTAIWPAGPLEGSAASITLSTDKQGSTPAGVTTSDVPDGWASLLASTSGPRADHLAFAAVKSPDAALLVQLKGVLAEPVVISTAAGPSGAGRVHLVVEVAPHTEGVLILEHAGGGALSEAVEIVVGDGARLDVVSHQAGPLGTVLASAQAISVGRDAVVSHTTVTTGGDVSRVVPTVQFTGPGGDVSLRGVAFTDAHLHHEHRLHVDHAVPHCKSRVLYRQAISGEGAHAVWIGDVIIRPAAIGTDTYEGHRTLVLSDGTRVDSVPNLEIETGEIVGAGHASATGRLDEEAMFYLMSRGIDADTARRLVLLGFIGEVLHPVHAFAPALADELTAHLAALVTSNGEAA